MGDQLTRTGVARVRANKLDPVYQDFFVREHLLSDGDVYRDYYHSQLSKYVSLPDEWLGVVVWDATPRI